MSAAAYLTQLQALLPQGAAWPREAQATLTLLLQAVADELARADGRADALINEADPRTTAELLADWELVAGLPEPCITAAQTIAERRAALVNKLTNRGGQDRAFYIALALALGYEVTITEFRPFVAGSSAGDELTNGDWIFTWRVNAPEETVRAFTAGSGAAGEALRSWGNELLECVIGRLKPAHTIVQFAYGN